MNLQQLRIIRETVRRQFNLTEAAAALNTSQSGVSKHIKDLELELGVELIVRKGKRLLGLTEPGREVATIVERLLVEAANIKTLGELFADNDSGHLTIATTHTQARYALTEVVRKFRTTFPKVHLTLHQGSPPEIAEMVASGTAEIGIATETLSATPQLATFSFYEWTHGIVVPEGHELESVTPLTLAAIAEHPIITYHEGFTGRGNIDKAFADAGIAPDVVMSAMDTDVLKTYVGLGLGVGIIASMAFSEKWDQGLRLLEVDELFPVNTTWIAVRRGSVLRRFAYRFMEFCSPALKEKAVRAHAAPHTDAPTSKRSIATTQASHVAVK
jgi:LysR family cys regulon transcriptional activator